MRIANEGSTATRAFCHVTAGLRVRPSVTSSHVYRENSEIRFRAWQTRLWAKKMGIGFVLLAAAIVGAIFAAVAAAVLGLLAAYLTRGVQRGRKLFIVATIAFPFLCLAWMGVVFALQAVINESYFHRDAGAGDAWNCPLPNGYALLMIDSPDEGFVYNMKTQPGSVVGEQDDAIAGVRLLQLSDRYILGGSNSRFGTEKDAKDIDSYFVLDTQTGTHISFPNRDSFERKAQELGVVLNLEAIQTVYGRFRFTWFDKLAAMLFFAPPLVGFALLSTWFVILRKRRFEIASAAG